MLSYHLAMLIPARHALPTEASIGTPVRSSPLAWTEVLSNVWWRNYSGHQCHALPTAAKAEQRASEHFCWLTYSRPMLPLARSKSGGRYGFV